MIVNFIEFLSKQQAQCRTCGYALTALTVLWSIFFVHHKESHFSLESLPAFWTFFTIASCIILVLFTGIYGKAGIKKKEDYYDK